MGRVTRWDENCSLTSSEEKKKRLVWTNGIKKVVLKVLVDEMLMSSCKTCASMNVVRNKLKCWGLLWGVF